MEFKYIKKPKKSTWVNFNEKTPEEYIGFVYEIECKENGRKYVGITRFWKKYTLPPLKGKQNKRHFQRETNWREYNTSGVLEQSLESNPDKYIKRVIRLCRTKTELKAYEAYIILQDYFNKHELYNEMIDIRLRLRR